MIDKIKFSKQIEEIQEESKNLRSKIIETMVDWMVNINLTVFPINAYPYRNLVLGEDRILYVESSEKRTATSLLNLTELQLVYNELKEAIAKNL